MTTKKANVSITINDLTKDEAAAVLAKLGGGVKTEVEDEGDEGDEGGEEETPKKGKGKKGKSDKKPGKKADKGGKGKKGKKADLNFDEDGEEDIDAETIRNGLLEYNQAYGKVKTAKLLKKFGAVNKAGKPDVSAIDEDDYEEIMNVITEALEEAE